MNFLQLAFTLAVPTGKWLCSVSVLLALSSSRFSLYWWPFNSAGLFD